MTSAPTEPAPRRTPLWLSTGARISLILAGLLLILSVYFLVVPLSVASSEGAPFGCSNALLPPSDAFARNSCGDVNLVYQLRALAALLSAAVVGVGGVLAFGARRPAPGDERTTA